MSWMEAWSQHGKPVREAEEVFASLPSVDPSEMLGDWKGAELPTGHPLDGLLELYGWWGKRFTELDRVDPLVFERSERLMTVDPARLPLGLALALPRIARTEAAVEAFRTAMPLLTTRRPKARLRSVAWRGLMSAAMIYDDLPIIDHFRRLDETRVLGLMAFRATPEPYFFQLDRAG